MGTHKKACDLTMEQLEEMCSESTTEKEVLKIKVRVNCGHSKGRARNIVRKVTESGIEVLKTGTIGDDGIEITSTLKDYAVSFIVPVDRLEELCNTLCIYPEDGTYGFNEGY